MTGKLLLAAAAMLVLTAVSVRRGPQTTLFCDDCVMRRDVTEWRLAGRWKLFPTSSSTPTPVTELLGLHHACPAHEHKWSAPTEVAEADLETSDAPRVRSIGLLNTPRAISFLRGLFEHADKESATIWRGVAWQPLYASALEPALRFRHFPENGFASRSDFLAWWSESAYPLFNKLHEMTEADENFGGALSALPASNPAQVRAPTRKRPTCKKHIPMKKSLLLSLLGALALNANAAPTVQIRLPERFRLLTDQRFDLRVEGTTLTDTNTALVQIIINGVDVTGSLPAPEVTVDNDSNGADPDKSWTYRSYSFLTNGTYTVVANVTDASGTGSTTNRIGVQKFSQTGLAKKNYILYIGDAMGTAYRDAGRLVAKSADGHMREGFYDDLQEMDKMPYTGLVMTYASDNIVPDSANTATAWTTGNKTINGTLNVFPDNSDPKAAGASSGSANKIYALDNPRVETLWEYLKRTQGYKAGIVTTADVCDATPAGEGGHTLFRSLLKDIARQYVDGIAGFTSGPEFDVILGGGKENFDARTVANCGDTRNLPAELIAAGFTYVTNRTGLNGLPAGGAAPDKLLGLFRTGNMDVAYDKLGYVRTSDEPTPNFLGFIDQPFLDEMTAKAISTLSKGGAPFILMVEGASIDKQSHPNHSGGVIWDVIEFDKAVGVGRTFSTNNPSGKNTSTLICVSADHDQSMSIVGLTDVTVPNAVANTRSQSKYPRTITLYDPFIGNSAAPGNGGNNVGEVSGFPNYVAGVNGYPSNTNRYRLAVGFRTGNHTGSSVPITAEGPGAALFCGQYDQTDIFFKAAKVLSSSTSSLDEFQKVISKLNIIGQNY